MGIGKYDRIALGGSSNDRSTSAHVAYRHSDRCTNDLIKSIDQKDGFQADVAGAKAMQTVPKRIVRLAMDE